MYIHKYLFLHNNILLIFSDLKQITVRLKSYYLWIKLSILQENNLLLNNYYLDFRIFFILLFHIFHSILIYFNRSIVSSK
jgi:hypothetical protein